MIKMTFGRHPLYVNMYVQVLVPASKRLFTRLDFQSNEGPESAYSVEKLVCEMSDFATLILTRGFCSS